jgi:hypothetical protein
VVDSYAPPFKDHLPTGGGSFDKDSLHIWTAGKLLSFEKLNVHESIHIKSKAQSTQEASNLFTEIGSYSTAFSAYINLS